MKKLSTFLLALFFMLSCANAQTTITVTSCVDTKVDSYQPNANFSASDEISAYAWTNGSNAYSRILIDFDLSAIIATNPNIISAKLYFYRNPNPTYAVPWSQGGNNKLLVQQVTQSWNHSTVTWNNKPSTTTTGQVEVPKAKSPYQNCEVDVTLLLEQIINSGNNYGFHIRLENETPYAVYCFASTEHSNPALRPKLVITYAANKQIILSDSMIYPLIHHHIVNSMPSRFVDEQNAIAPVTYPDSLWGTIYNNARYVFDLGAFYKLQHVQFYDTTGSDTIRVYTGNPANWKLAGKIKKRFWNTWPNGFAPWDTIYTTDTTRYLLFHFDSPQAEQVNEIRLYGSRYDIVQDTLPQTISRTLPAMDKLMGVTGGIWIDSSLLKCVGSVREYHNWPWNDGDEDFTNPGHTFFANYPEYPNNYMSFEPDYQKKHWDTGYKAWHLSGVDINPCVQLSALYIRPGKDPNVKPIFPIGGDSIDPNSYKAHSDFLFQYVARYGHNSSLNPSLMRLDDTTPVAVGKGYINYVENWNEQDKWYTGNTSTEPREVYFSPFEFAAMSSADYDGHEQTMHTDSFGVKNADPNIKMVMGGLLQLDLRYLQAMKLWSDYNRHGNHKFPADVINFHHYSNIKKISSPYEDSTGISPEEDHLKLKLKKLVDYRNTYLPELEIWLSEFGYDTHQGSPQRAPAISANGRNTTAYETQARWLMRSFLEIAAAGIDRAHCFNIEDFGDTSYRFNTCGLLKKVNPLLPPPYYERKNSWYYLKAMKDNLAGFHFSKELASGDSRVNLYEFVNETNDSIIYAAWCNTSNNTVINNFKIALGIDYCSVELITPLKPLIPHGTPYSTSSLTITSDSISLDSITELPVFIRKVRPQTGTGAFEFTLADTSVCKGTGTVTANMNSPVATSCRYFWKIERTDTLVATGGAYSKQRNAEYFTYDSLGQVPNSFNFPGFDFKPGATYKVSLTAKTCGSVCTTYTNSKLLTVPLSVSINAGKTSAYNSVLQTGQGTETELFGTVHNADSFRWTPVTYLNNAAHATDTLYQIAQFTTNPADSIVYTLIAKGDVCADTAYMTIRFNRLASAHLTDQTVCLNNNTVVMGNAYDASLLTGVLYYISGSHPNDAQALDNLYMGYYNSDPAFYDLLSGYMLRPAAKSNMQTCPPLAPFVNNNLDKNQFYQTSWYAAYLGEYYYGSRITAIDNFINEVNNDANLQSLLSSGTLGYTWDNGDVGCIQNFLLQYNNNYYTSPAVQLATTWEGHTTSNGWNGTTNVHTSGNWDNHFVIDDAPTENTKYRFTVTDNQNSRVEYDEAMVYVDTLLVIPYFLPYLQEDSTVYFINLSEPYSPVTTFSWKIYGNAPFSTEPDPVYTFPAYNQTYYVCLSLWNECMPNGAAWCDSVRVDTNGLGGNNFMAAPVPPNKKETRFNTKVTKELLNDIAANGLTQELKEKIMKGVTTKISDKPSMEVLPNPFSNYTNIVYDIKAKDAETNQQMQLSLINSVGARVKTIELTNTSGTVRLESAGLAAGMYYCQLLVNGVSVVNKIVIIQ